VKRSDRLALLFGLAAVLVGVLLAVSLRFPA